MAFHDEAVPLLRSVIGDDESPYEFGDQRLTRLLSVSAFQVYQQIRDVSSREYVVDMLNDGIDPDPAGTSLTDADRDESFINLTVLKAACSLQNGAARKAAGTALVVKDKDAFQDTRSVAAGLIQLLNSGYSFCAEYQTALSQFWNDNSAVAGAAVIGPYRSGVVGGGGGGGRRPGGGNRKYFG